MDVAMEKVAAAASAGEPRLMNRLSEQRRVEVAAEVERQVSTRLLAEREEAADAAVRALVDGPVGPAAKPRPKAKMTRGSVGQAKGQLTADEAVALEEGARAARQNPRWVEIDPVRFSPFPCGTPMLPMQPKAPPPPELLGIMPTQPKAPPPPELRGMKDAREEVGLQVEKGKDVHEERRAAKAEDGGEWRARRVPSPPPPPARRATAMDLSGPSASSRAPRVPTPPVPVARPKVAVTYNQIQRVRAKTDEVLKARLDSYGDEKKRIKEARRSWLSISGPDVPLPKALMPRLPDGRLSAVDMVTGASLNVPYEGPELLY